MNGKKTTMGFFAVILTAFLLCQAAFAQSAVPTRLAIDYSATSIEQNRQPGDSGLMNIAIKNVGGQDAGDVEVYIPDAGDIKVSKREYLGTIRAGETVVISGIKYNIASDASIGRHTVKVNVLYDGFNVYGKADNDQRDGFELVINVGGESIFVVDGLDAGKQLKPGDTATIKISVKNVGIAGAYDAEAELSTSEALQVLGAAKQYVGNIDAGSNKQVSYVVHIAEGVPSGTYSVPLILTYRDEDHTSTTASLSIGVKISGETRFSVTVSETDPQEIHADDTDVELSIKADNTGTNDLKNVKITYLPVYPFKNARSYVQTKDLGTVKSSASAQAAFYADVDEDAPAERTQQSFFVEYEFENNRYNATVNVSVDVMDHPRFEISDNGTQATAGGSAQIRMSIKNTGAKCESVNVWALKESSQPFDFDEKSEYIGDLDRGESGEAVLGFSVEGGATAKEYILPVEIRCVREGDVLTYGKTVRINVADGESGGLNPLYLAAVAVILILAFATYRNKKKKQ